MLLHQYKIVSGVLIVAGVLLTVLFAIMAWSARTDAWLVLCAAALLLFLGHTQTIKKFKIGAQGVSAEMRDLVERGESIKTELAQFTAVNAKAIISLAFSKNGYVEQYNDSDREHIYKLAREMLSVAKASDKQRNDALAEAESFFDNEYLATVLSSITARRPSGQIPELLKQDRQSLTPERVAEIVGQDSATHSFTLEWIKDWEYWRHNKQHRRPGHWFQRRDLL